MASKRQREKLSAAPVEVCASFSYKLNHGIRGGAQYESSDWFQSMKTTVPAAEADAMAEKLRSACRRDVLKAANEQVESLRNGTWERKVEPNQTARTNAAAFERAQSARRAGSPPEPRNHATGTQAAADAVAQRKIAELKGE